MATGEPVDPGNVTLSLHGPGVTVGDAIDVAKASKEMLDDIARAAGYPLEWDIVSIQFQCDGCGLKRPDRPRPDEGWTHDDGDDFCPTCTADRGGR